jgi:hypothetical protein
MLTRHPDWRVRVIAIWEPILPTDWTSPSGSTLARMGDSRVRQFWDPKHSVSGALSEIVRRKPLQREPGCCIKDGFHWDQAILYAPQSKWKDSPSSVFWNGPVAPVSSDLEKALAQEVLKILSK